MSGADLDELFAAPLGEFVAVRNDVARRLRAEGKKEEADEVAAVKKPSAAVWAVNQLSRRQRRDVDLLLDVGHRLRAAHAESDPAQARKAFDGARQAEHEAMGRLLAAAEGLLEEEQGTASRAMLDRVASTLRAAAVTDEGREQLARGRLTEELETTGFELAAAAAPKTRPARSRGRAKEDPAAARAALAEAQKRKRDADARVRDAEKEAAAAKRALEAAEKTLAEARAEAEEAAAEFERAKKKK